MTQPELHCPLCHGTSEHHALCPGGQQWPPPYAEEDDVPHTSELTETVRRSAKRLQDKVDDLVKVMAGHRPPSWREVRLGGPTAPLPDVVQPVQPVQPYDQPAQSSEQLAICPVCGLAGGHLGRCPYRPLNEIPVPEPEPASADPFEYQRKPCNGNERRVILLNATPDPLGAIAAFGKMYKGEPVSSLSEITDEERRSYFQDALASHLRAPLETVDLHFMLEGYDRAFQQQLTRQRVAVYAGESLRFAQVDDLVGACALPPTVERGSAAANVWGATLEQIQYGYSELLDLGVPAEDARGLLPMATPTRIQYKTNLRALADHAGNRLCTQAQFVWREVLAGIVAQLRLYGPSWQTIAASSLFQPVCYSVGKCPFKGSWDRGCKIRDRVDAGRFDEIDDSEWMLDPEAAR